MDKRKGIILAIVLFLIIGLGTFVFANDSDNIADDGQNGDTINDPSSNDDGSDDQTTSDTTEQSESSDEESSGEGGNRNNTINRRPTSANDSDNESDGSGSDDSITAGQTVNYKELLDQLAKMVDEASDKDALALAEEFRKDNNITEGNIDALGDATASETFDEIMAILTDNESPVITPANLNDNYFKEAVKVTITDDTKTAYTITLNGNDVTDSVDLANLTDEGTYVLTVKDAAFNETVVTFAVDRTNPVLLVNGEEVEDGETIYVNKNAILTVDETNLESFTSNGSDRTENVLNGSWTAQKDGTYNIVVTDKAGNETTYTIVVDKTPIELNHLYILNNSHNDSDYNLTDENRYKVIGNGQELYVEYVLKEEFTSTPVLTIGGQEFEMNCGTASWNDSLYKCDAHITITEDMKLENGEVIPFTITGVKDEAQNETIVTEKDVTVTEKYGQVIYDGKAPKYNQLGILNVDHLRNDEDITVAKYGDEIRVLFHFTEELAVNPKMTIGESKKVYELELNEDYDNFKEYTYVADITLTEDMNFADGALVYTIYGYADAAGNVGKTIKSTDEIKTYTKYPGVEIDNTAPTRGYSTLGFEYTDNSDKTSLEINGEKVYYVKPEDSFLYKIAFSEKIQDGLIATIAGTDISLEYLDYNEDLGYIYGGTYTVPSGLTEGERLEIVVSNIKDLAGNEYAAGTITDVPTSNGRVAVFDNTPAGYNSVDFYVNNGYQEGSEYYATYGSTIVANIRTNELLRENPTFEFTYGDEKIVISGDDVEFTDEEKEEYTYLYRVRYTIPEDFEKIEEEVTLNITNIVDYAGNITDNGSTGITNRNRVFIDTLAPQVEELRFNSSNSINNGYANNTHSVGVYITVHEELGEVPTFVIDGNEYSKTEERENDNGYLYAAVTKLPEDTEEGKLTFSVTVTDKAGNTATYTNDDIKNDVEGYDGVIYDTTAPELTLVGTEETYDNILRIEAGTEITLEYVLATATDASFDGEITVEPYRAEFYANTGIAEDNDYTYDFSNGFDTRKPTGSRYNIYYKVTDKAGNTTEDVMILAISDTTAATITPNQDDNYHVEYGSEYTSVTATVTDNVDETDIIEPWEYIRFDFQFNNLGEVYYNNTFDTTKPGRYLAIWDYKDSSGNVSNTLKRWVIVSDTTGPDIEGVEDNGVYIVSRSMGYQTGGIVLKITDNSKYYTITFDDEVFYNVSDDTLANTFKNGLPYHETLNGVDICAEDTYGNKSCVKNVTIINIDEAGFESALANGGNVVLPENTTIKLNGSVNVPSNTTIIGSSTSKIIGSLNLTGSNITLKDVNIENDNTTINISENAENIVIDGGTYTTNKTTSGNPQGQGTIRVGNVNGEAYTSPITIRNATLKGGIHLLNYTASVENITGNNITIENDATPKLVGILVVSDYEGYTQDTADYLNNQNTIKMNYYDEVNQHYLTAIQYTDWADRYFVLVK